MGRPVTLFTGQWADLKLEDLCKKAVDFGYDGLELACWGDHFEVAKALSDDTYCARKRDLLERHGLKLFAISNHLAGQAVLDTIDARHKKILPDYVWGDGEPAGVNERAIEEMKNTARAAQKLGVDVVNGFTGSSIWHLLYDFPPTDPEMIEAGFQLLAERWNPILDVFQECGVKFALEVHPTEIAFDIYTSERALKALDHREEFGFNFDPSHLLWQGIDPVEFIRALPGPHLPRPHERCQNHAQWKNRDFDEPFVFRRSPARLGFPQRGSGRGAVRGNYPGIECGRLSHDETAFGRMGRHGHEPRCRCRRSRPILQKRGF